MNDTVIEVTDLCKSFDRKDVLRNLSLTVPRGSVLGLLGKNGSGKSTLIKCLTGLLQPSGGSTRIFGEESWDLSADAKLRLGYAPQEVSLYPWMRVRQLIEYTSSFYPNWNRAQVDALARRWELPLEERVGPMSLGQQQKVSLLLALGHEPDLLILDEPVASLDPAARREFLSTILEIAGVGERTVVFSTHITSDLERVADRVAILREGKIVDHEELDDLKDRVKRLRIHAANDLPASFAVAGALRCEVSGPNALVAVRDVHPPLLSELQSQWNADVTVEDLSLEDIFLEIHHAS